MVKIGALTVREVAELKGCSIRFIQSQIKKGELKAEETISEANNRKMYVIEPDSLPEELKAKYYKSQKKELKETVQKVDTKVSKKVRSAKSTPSKEIDKFTEEEREQIDLWINILNEWQVHRLSYEIKAEADEVFVVMKKDYFKKNGINETISRSILYRKYKNWKEGNLQGLIENRGKSTKGNSSLTDYMKQVFNTYYLDQNKLTVSQAYRYTQWYFEVENPEVLEAFPSERVFRRHSLGIEEAIILYMRYGNKAVYDKIAPHFVREYENMEANDCWIADGHTLDIISKEDATGKKHRLTLTAFMDAKTGVMCGWHISDNPCSQATILALRHGIMRMGKPKTIYCDNGREYLTYDLGGKGHRHKKSKEGLDVPPNILERLDIKMINAIVANARAKNIERAFDTLKNYISRNTTTFTGGTHAERPERHSKVIKNDDVILDSELKEYINNAIDGIYNVDNYGGCENRFKGMSRIEVWNYSIQNTDFVKVPEENLNLLLMRSSMKQKVSRSTVYITIFGKKWIYRGEDLWRYNGQEVYLRVDPDNPQKARLYNNEDQFMFEVETADMLKAKFLEDDQDKIQKGMKEIRRVEKAVKKAGKEMVLTADERIDALDISIRKAVENMQAGVFQIVHPEGSNYELTEKEKPISQVTGFDSLELLYKDGKFVDTK